MDLLGEIESGALDSNADLPDLLRKCIALGGATGSARLRDWATRELKGYGSDDELPPYRVTRSLLFLDAALVGGHVRGQQVPITLIPHEALPSIQGDIPLPQPVSALVDLITSTRRKGEDAIRLAPPHAQELLALMNHRLAKMEERPWGGPLRLPPSQQVERVYWIVGLSEFTGIVDAVRTTLVELVAEMRAGTSPDGSMPSHDIAEQAVDIAINGNRNRIVVNQLAPDAQGAASAGGTSAVGDAPAETRSRRVMWWVAGVSAVIGAGAAVVIPLWG